MNAAFNLLQDLVQELKERLSVAQEDPEGFSQGRALAFAEVLDHLKNQAEVFGLSLEDLGLRDFDATSHLSQSRGGGTLPTTSTKS